MSTAKRKIEEELDCPVDSNGDPAWIDEPDDDGFVDAVIEEIELEKTIDQFYEEHLPGRE